MIGPPRGGCAWERCSSVAGSYVGRCARELERVGMILTLVPVVEGWARSTHQRRWHQRRCQQKRWHRISARENRRACTEDNNSAGGRIESTSRVKVWLRAEPSSLEQSGAARS